MQKSVNPWVALVVILVFGSLLGGYLWAGTQWLALDRLGFIKQTPDQQLALQLSRQIIIVNLSGEITETIDFSPFLQKDFIGDFAFFSNGDLLLLLNHDSDGVLEQLEVVARITNYNNKPASENSPALYRCSRPILKCTLFGTSLPEMNRTFRLFIDADNKVYMADTSRHRIVLLDEQGNVLAEKEGFRFPNHIYPVDEGIAVADTNHHQIAIVEPEVKNYGAQRRAFKVQLAYKNIDGVRSLWDRVIRNKHVWPIHFLVASNHYWVLVGDSALSHGRIALFDNNGIFQREVMLEKNADPITMISYSDRILVVDMANYQIAQFDEQANRLGNISIPGLDPILYELKGKSDRYAEIQNLCLSAFVLLLIAGFCVAIPQHLAHQRIEKADRDKLINSPWRGEGEIWLEPDKKSRRNFTIGFVSMALFGPLCIAALLYIGNYKERSAVMLIAFAVMYLIVMVIYYSVFNKIYRQKLGILSDRLVLIAANGEKFQACYDQIYWTNNTLAIQGKQLAISQNGPGRIFDYETMLRNILPRLDKNKKISQLAMLTRQLEENPMARLSFIAGIVIVVCSIAVQYILKH